VNGLTKKEAPDRSKINLHDPCAVKGWCHELGVSKEQLRMLVDKVGNAAAAVRKELDHEKSNGSA
jgi:hypothetical protein